MRLWISTLGASLDDGSTGETRYEGDLPLCCRGEASNTLRGSAGQTGEDAGSSHHFECAACGAAWQRPLPVEPELDAFAYRANEERGEAA